MNILVIHGPNLNLLGKREPEIYGRLTLAEINSLIKNFASSKNARTRIFQSNCEGKLIDLIQKNSGWADWLVINPAAYTHYSYAIADAISAAGLAAVEVHLTDIKKREAFRRKSVIAPVCRKQICGLGVQSYLKAVDFCCSSKKPRA